MTKEQIRLTVPAEWRRLHRSGRPPRIMCDTELKAFVDEALFRMTFEEVSAECSRRFGAARAPSKSCLHRYWHTYAKHLQPQAKGATS